MLKKILMWLGIAILAGAATFVLLVVFYPIPDPNETAVAESSRVLYTDGEAEIGQFGDVKRTFIPLDDVPIDTQHAVLSAEDRNFYEHGAISISGLARAAWNNLTGGATQGGSTITQQYVKNMYLTQDQTIVRKFKELILSIKLEIVWSKEEILEGYLNTIYFGRGAYGIEAASQAYYAHPASELDTAEGAAVAAIIQSPGNYEPSAEENLPRLQNRFDYVVDGMVEQEWLSSAEANALVLPEFAPRSSNRFGGQVGYIMTTVKSELLEQGFTEAQIDGGGLTIVTTIDKQAQDSIVATVQANGPTSGTEGLRIGIAAVEPGTGSILAMYGGPDYVQNSFNNATQARAQAGSTFKPYALAAAFENGITLDSVWNGNSPRTISGYTLQNEGNKSYGNVTLLRATEQSINTPFVEVTDEVGVQRVINAAFRAGLPRDTPGIEENLTFVLGTASPTALDVASTYATFATRGVYHEPTIVKEVILDGSSTYQQTSDGEERFDATIMDNVNFALQRVVSNGTGGRASALGRPNAGKTGTTDDNKSAWYAGYTPQVSAAVMMSKEDANGRPISLRGTGGLNQVFGSSFPLSMWLGFAQGYLEGKPVEQFVSAPDLPGFNNPDTPTESPSPTESPTESPSPEPSETETAEPTPSASPVPSDTAEPSPPVEDGGAEAGAAGSIGENPAGRPTLHGRLGRGRPRPGGRFRFPSRSPPTEPDVAELGVVGRPRSVHRAVRRAPPRPRLSRPARGATG